MTEDTARPGRLVLVATPIGNLEDLSQRAARVLGEADLIAAEDTRRTRVLLDHLGIRVPMISVHEHNEDRRARPLLDRVEAGEVVAVVTDAGTPGLADPGFVLVRAARARGLPVEAIPGPAAAIQALVLSGLPMDRFVFEGFLPRRPGQRARRLAELAGEERTLVFYVAPHRAAQDLQAMAEAFGDREAALARELTKLHEEVWHADLPALAERAADGVRGEVTVVVAGSAPERASVPDSAELAQRVADLVDAGMDRREATAEVAQAAGVPKRRVYQAVLDTRQPPAETKKLCGCLWMLLVLCYGEIEQEFWRRWGHGWLRSAVEAFVATDLDELDDAALGEYLREASVQRDRLDAACHRAIRAQDRRAAWKTDGAHSQKEWLAKHCRLSLGQASRQAETARRLAALPQTAQAVADGTLGMSQAQVAAAAVRDLGAEAAAGLDQLVTETGPEVDAAQLRSAVDEYAHRVQPESLAAREERAWRARRLTVSRTVDGAVAIDGRLDPVGGEAVLTALAPLAAPTDAGDTRTPEQRRADALVTLCRRGLDAGDLPEVGGVRPHVTVVVPLETLHGHEGAPPATLDRSGAISGDAARVLACDSGITRVITMGASQPIDVGRETRVVSPGQRRALAVRDGGCIGCRAPAGWCEAHHVRFWTEHKGPTDLDNLVLVCWRCHRNIHHHGWRPVRGPDGRWTLRQ